jgi:Uma2 family endonuclease
MEKEKSFEEWKREKLEELEKEQPKLSDKFTYRDGDIIVTPPEPDNETE